MKDCKGVDWNTEDNFATKSSSTRKNGRASDYDSQQRDTTPKWQRRGSNHRYRTTGSSCKSPNNCYSRENGRATGVWHSKNYETQSDHRGGGGCETGDCSMPDGPRDHDCGRFNGADCTRADRCRYRSGLTEGPDGSKARHRNRGYATLRPIGVHGNARQNCCRSSPYEHSCHSRAGTHSRRQARTSNNVCACGLACQSPTAKITLSPGRGSSDLTCNGGAAAQFLGSSCGSSSWGY